MNEDDFAELSAGHALGALSPEDERAYLAALAAHPEWADVAAQDAETAAALGEGVAPVAPPITLRSQLLGAIAASVAADAASTAPDATETGAESPTAAPVAESPLPTDVVQTIERRTWSRGLFALVASIALLVGIGWGAGTLAQLWQSPASITALEQIERAPDANSAQTDFDGGTATVHWSQSLGKVVLVADGLPTIPDDRTFELWYVRGGSAASAGTFSAKAGASTAQLSGSMQPGDTIAVTVEHSGGAPDGSPTTDPLFTIPTA